jgi:hypothetical protein
VASAPVAAKFLAREKGWDSATEANAVTEYTARISGFLNELDLGEG